MVQLTEASGCARPEIAGAEGRLQLWSSRRKCMMESDVWRMPDMEAE